MQSFGSHVSVLLDEAVEALSIRPDGRYVDATYGRGGHACKILERLGEGGRLYAVDRDPLAVSQAQSRFADEPRFKIFNKDFADIALLADEQGFAGAVDGLLIDLGVSSPQLDDAARGFSFSKDGPLDMRMNTQTGETAADWLRQATVDEMVRVFRDYGEERYAPRIARAIATHRETTPFTTTLQLAEVVKTVHPRWEKGKHPATRVFQAIRIQVNGELDALRSVLKNAEKVLAVGGRLVIISFHSLEDRIVKKFMRSGFAERDLPRGFPVELTNHHPFKVLSKPIFPQEHEVQNNVRARSAVLRVAEKCT